MSEDDEDQNEEMWDDIYAAFERANQVKFSQASGKALLDAARHGDIHAVEEILSAPAERGGLILLRLLAKDVRGNSALHLAAAGGRKEMVELLLRHGLTPDVKNNLGETPKDVALKAGHLSVVAVLELYGTI